MNRSRGTYIFIFYCLIVTSVFSQKKSNVVITGTVYISSSTSMGTLNGGSISEPQHAFIKQPIYFKNDSTTIKGVTDSLGVFSVKLKEGMYTVYQEEGLKKNKSSMMQFASVSIEVKKMNEPYRIIFQNSSNRRSAINDGTPSLGGSNIKTTKKSKQK